MNDLINMIFLIISLLVLFMFFKDMSYSKIINTLPSAENNFK
jgi:hypothetical protein